MKELAAVELLLEILASEASPLFRELQQSNLINESSFSYEFFEGPGYASVILQENQRILTKLQNAS